MRPSLLLVAVVVGVASANGCSLDDASTTLPTVGDSAGTSNDFPGDAGSVRVIGVTDGDTFVALVDGAEENIRLIGIDAPEQGECFHSEATDALESALDAGAVALRVDTSDRDRFGRLLRHVWVGGVHVNERLVAEGVAIARRYPPDTSLADELDQAQRDARLTMRGLWAADACGPPVGDAALVITHVEYDAPGDDNEALNGEWVVITNTGANAVDLEGWLLRDESASHRFAFGPETVLEPAATVTVYSGCGEPATALDGSIGLHWCVSGSAIWNNSGDTAFLLDPSGNIVATFEY